MRVLASAGEAAEGVIYLGRLWSYRADIVDNLHTYRILHVQARLRGSRAKVGVSACKRPSIYVALHENSVS